MSLSLSHSLSNSLSLCVCVSSICISVCLCLSLSLSLYLSFSLSLSLISSPSLSLSIASSLSLSLSFLLMALGWQGLDGSDLPPWQQQGGWGADVRGCVCVGVKRGWCVAGRAHVMVAQGASAAGRPVQVCAVCPLSLASAEPLTPGQLHATAAASADAPHTH